MFPSLDIESGLAFLVSPNLASSIYDLAIYDHNLVILCSSAPGPLNASLNFLRKLTCKYLYLNVYLHVVVVKLRAIFSPSASVSLSTVPNNHPKAKLRHPHYRTFALHHLTFASPDICISGHLGESKCS